jgi:hypothetical protein
LDFQQDLVLLLVLYQLTILLSQVVQAVVNRVALAAVLVVF